MPLRMPPLLAHRDMSKLCMAHAPSEMQHQWTALHVLPHQSFMRLIPACNLARV